MGLDDLVRLLQERAAGGADSAYHSWELTINPETVRVIAATRASAEDVETAQASARDLADAVLAALQAPGYVGSSSVGAVGDEDRLDESLRTTAWRGRVDLRVARPDR